MKNNYNSKFDFFQPSLCLKKGMMLKMDNNQKINCDVESCMHQDGATQKCKLSAINVVPAKGCTTRKADESMCGNYKCCD